MKTLMHAMGLLCLLMAAACKKQASPDPHIEFDMDGTHYSYPLGDGQLQTPNGQRKILTVSTAVNFSLNAAQLTLFDEQSQLSSDLMSTGTYHNFYADGSCQDTAISGCLGYSLMVMQPEGVWMLYFADSTSGLIVTSCTGNPPVINATFTGSVSDPNTATQLHQVTNGKLVNATYVRVP